MTEAHVRCPFRYASGKQCEGEIVGARAYGRSDRYGFVRRENVRKIRLWCSVRSDHAGIDRSLEAKERMEFYPDELPDEIADTVWQHLLPNLSE